MVNKIIAEVLRKESVQELVRKHGAILKAQFDDVFVGANTLKATLQLLDEVFETLVKYNCRSRIDKCEFLKSIIEYLGFDIGDRWWAPRAAKLGLGLLSQIHLDDNSAPAGISSFLGAVGFYKHHVPRFTWNSGPLSDSIKKKNPRKWDKECSQAFEELQQKMKPNEPFIIVTNSCDYGCGGSLHQFQRVEESKRRQSNKVPKVMYLD